MSAAVRRVRAAGLQEVRADNAALRSRLAEMEAALEGERASHLATADLMDANHAAAEKAEAEDAALRGQLREAGRLLKWADGALEALDYHKHSGDPPTHDELRAFVRAAPPVPVPGAREALTCRKCSECDGTHHWLPSCVLACKHCEATAPTCDVCDDAATTTSPDGGNYCAPCAAEEAANPSVKP